MFNGIQQLSKHIYSALNVNRAVYIGLNCLWETTFLFFLVAEVARTHTAFGMGRASLYRSILVWGISGDNCFGIKLQRRCQWEPWLFLVAHRKQQQIVKLWNGAIDVADENDTQVSLYFYKVRSDITMTREMLMLMTYLWHSIDMPNRTKIFISLTASPFCWICF